MRGHENIIKCGYINSLVPFLGVKISFIYDKVSLYVPFNEFIIKIIEYLFKFIQSPWDA